MRPQARPGNVRLALTIKPLVSDESIKGGIIQFSLPRLQLWGP